MFTPSGFRRALALIAVVLGAVLLWSVPARAENESKLAVVVPVSGLIDPANESLILTSIRDANRRNASLIVLQVNSPGATDASVSALIAAMETSAAPVVVWVGPSGGEARSAAAALAVAAPLSGMSNGARIGPADPLRLDRPNASTPTEVGDQLAGLATRNGRSAAAARSLATRSYSTKEAVATGVVDVAGSTLQEFVGNLDGRTVQTARGPVAISTARANADDPAKRELTVVVQLTGLSLGQQLIHTLTNPSVAYFLLVTGFALIVFEFFAASIGIAAVTGAICLVAAFTGFGHLPMHWWAVGLIAFGVFGFAIDVQVGRFGFWTVVGFLSALAGSIFLYAGAPQLDPSWWVIALVMLGLVLFMLGGMTGIVRTRFSTPTLGREGMIGAMGTAEVEIAPDGIVTINDARWTARTNRATPIAAGDPVRVVAVEGFILEVEPESGGAVDYREQARKRKAARADAATGDKSPEDPGNSA